METRCKIDFYVAEVDVDETLPLLNTAIQDPELTLTFAFNGDMDRIREMPFGFFEFSLAFEKWFKQHKASIVEGIACISDIDRPSFYAYEDGIVGISTCTPNDVYVQMVVSWDKVRMSFQEWFESGDFDLYDDFDTIQDLYETLRDKHDGAYFQIEVSPSEGVNLKSSYLELPTIHLNEEQRQDALRFLDSLYELTIDGEASFRHNMAKND